MHIHTYIKFCRYIAEGVIQTHMHYQYNNYYTYEDTHISRWTLEHDQLCTFGLCTLNTHVLHRTLAAGHILYTTRH